jgi:hypothetical protein
MRHRTTQAEVPVIRCPVMVRISHAYVPTIPFGSELFYSCHELPSDAQGTTASNRRRPKLVVVTKGNKKNQNSSFASVH